MPPVTVPIQPQAIPLRVAALACLPHSSFAHAETDRISLFQCPTRTDRLHTGFTPEHKILIFLYIKRRRLVLLFDGAGLGLFAVAGTQKALLAGLNPVMAIFMGVLTGIGGGILRDVLVNQTPTVLQADIYAVAALAAGVVVVIGYVLHYPAFVMMTAGALLCFNNLEV